MFRLVNGLLTALGEDHPPVTFFTSLLPAVWPRLVGGRLARISRPGGISNGRLTVFLNNSQLKRDLKGLESVFLQKASLVVPAVLIKEVVFQVMPFSTERTAREKGPCPVYPKEWREWAERCVQQVQSPHLRNELMEAMIVQRARMSHE